MKTLSIYLRLFVQALGLALVLASVSARAADLIPNGGFEAGLESWRPFWTRLPNTGAAALDQEIVHGGKAALRIEHRGEQDWSLEPLARVPAQPGDLFEFEAWLRLDGQADLSLCASTWDAQGKVVDWSFASRGPVAQPGWQRVRSRFAAPEGVAEIQPRLIGSGAARFWVDDVRLTPLGKVKRAQSGPESDPWRLESPALLVEGNRRDGAFEVRDKLSERIWRQRPLSGEVMVQGAVVADNRVALELLHASEGLVFTATLSLQGRELLVELQGEGDLHTALKYPHPFAGEPGDYLVIPMNEGISYPVEDECIALHRLIAYGGHGICMAFFGATDGARGWMGILETADDAAIKLNRADGRLLISPEWDAQKRQFGYARKLRYVFFEQGGHVAIAKRYRTYAQQSGLLKTLEEKRQANPNVDLLMGAVNVWCWDRDAVPLVREMQAAGIERILHYFEGMLSLGPYRVPDSGRRMQVIWTNVPPAVAKYQLGHRYRLPLWELVYHDCVVAQWYWGDYSNKLPALWDKRDLFNALYGTPPMFMFDRKLWAQEKQRFAQSYRKVCPLVRQVAYAEMTDHRFLTPDRAVQQTSFANGTTVTVNFGEAPFRLADGKMLSPLGLEVTDATRPRGRGS